MGHKEADLRIATKPVYRPDIDGMRAIAILSVVIFHAFPEFLSGGFVGVDVFFVISGYLITGIILTGLQRGKFSFLQFYVHRVKRIFPALLLVLFIIFIAGWFLLLPDEFSLLGKHIFTSVLYLQNFALSRESGYFDVASGLKPLTHMWSLAVEEQFYLIFPFFLFFAERLRFNVLVLIVVGASVSFFLNIQAVANNAGVAYYLPQVRFWELLVGSFLAYVNLHKRAAFFSVLAKLAFGLSQVVIGNVLSLIGLTLIGCSLFLIDKSVPFPGWWGAVPVFGAFFLILAGPRAWVNKSLLSSRYMVFVGLISYPLYLWHWPLLSFGHVLFDGALPARISLSIVAASFVLAWLTYYLIERPVRLGGNERFRVVVMLLMSISIGVAGFYIYIKKGFPARYSEFAELQAAAVEWDYPGRLAVKNSDGISYFEQRSSGDSATLYLGDSHMEQYYPRIEQLIVSNPDVTNSAIFKTGGGGMPVPNLSPDTAHSYCKNMMFEASKIMEDRQDIDRVVIAAQWNGYMVDGFGLSPRINPGDEGYNKILKNLSDFIQGLVADGKVVYLITTIPIGEELDPKYMVQRELSAFPHVFKLRSGGVDVSRLEGKYGKVRRDLKRIGRESGALVIDPVDYLCKDRCESVDAQGRPRYKDLTHLRPTFVRNHADYLDETIIN